MMVINGEKFDIKAATLEEVCLYYSEDPESVATALNGEFIPKALRMQTHINDGDHIEIIAPLEGGRMLRLYGQEFTSRLLLGTARYPSS